MTNNVKTFIERHIDLIEDKAFVTLFTIATSVLSSGEVAELTDVLLDIGVNTYDVRLEVLDDSIKGYVRDNLTSHYKTDSNSWSRLDYMMMYVPMVGFSYYDIREHLLNDGKDLGLNVKELEPQYGWEGAGDLDLGWFNKEAYEKENF